MSEKCATCGGTGTVRTTDSYGDLVDCDECPEDAPVPGGPPMREGNNPRTGIAWNE